MIKAICAMRDGHATTPVDATKTPTRAGNNILPGVRIRSKVAERKGNALKNPKHERFAQELAKGKSATEAYRLAGYKPDDGHASRLAGNGRVLEGPGLRRLLGTLNALGRTKYGFFCARIRACHFLPISAISCQTTCHFLPQCGS